MVKKKINWKVISYFLHDSGGAYLFIAMLGVFLSILEAVSLAIFYPMMNTIIGTGKSALSYNSGYSNWIDGVLKNAGFRDTFIVLCIIFLGISTVKFILSVFYDYIVSKESANIMHRCRNKLVGIYEFSPLSIMVKKKIGGLVYDITKPPTSLCMLMSAIPRCFINIAKLISVLVILLYCNYKLTICLIIFSSMFFLILSKFAKDLVYRYSKIQKTSEKTMEEVISEWLRGLRSIRIAEADEYWVEKFRKNSLESKSAFTKCQTILSSPISILEFTSFICLFSGILFVYSFYPNTFVLHMGTIGFFAMGIVRLIPAVAVLSRLPLDINNLLPDTELLYELLTTNRLEQAKKGQYLLPSKAISITLEKVGVSFPATHFDMKDISLAIDKKKVVAIVGPSGSGKTTILNLILGIVEPCEGNILINDIPISFLNKRKYLKNIGYVGQDINVFSGTIKENITFFRQDISDDIIVKAAKVSYLHDFILTLPKGYDTNIREAGYILSGGQKQRLAIARALVHNPGLLILDEATSALDVDTEREVMGAIRNAARDRTVLIVTHKLHTIKWVDEIILIESGHIKEYGKWKNNTEDIEKIFSI